MCCWLEVFGVISTTDHHKSATGPAWNHQQTHVFMFRWRKWKRWGHLNFSFPFLLSDSVAGIKARAHPVLQMLEESVPFESTFIFFWHRALYTSSKTEWDEVSDFHQSNIWTSVCVCGVVCESVCVCPCGLSGVCVRESVCLCSNDTETVLSARITLSFFFYQNQHHVFPDSFCSNYTGQYLNTSDHK